MLEEAKQLCKQLEDHGYAAYLVGGCVRDFLLGLPLKDIDIATDAHSDDVATIFEEYHPNSFARKYGVIELKKPLKCQITTFRTEGNYLDYRRPSTIQFVRDVKLDSKRRDFTINALYMDKEGKILDFFDGVKHLDQRRLVCIGDPMIKIKEDALRILRAIRFAIVYNLTIDPALDKAMLTYRKNLDFLSIEVIAMEVHKLLKLPLTSDKAHRLMQLSHHYHCEHLYLK